MKYLPHFLPTILLCVVSAYGSYTKDEVFYIEGICEAVSEYEVAIEKGWDDKRANASGTIRQFTVALERLLGDLDDVNYYWRGKTFHEWQDHYLSLKKDYLSILAELKAIERLPSISEVMRTASNEIQMEAKKSGITAIALCKTKYDSENSEDLERFLRASVVSNFPFDPDVKIYDRTEIPFVFEENRLVMSGLQQASDDTNRWILIVTVLTPHGNSFSYLNYRVVDIKDSRLRYCKNYRFQTNHSLTTIDSEDGVYQLSDTFFSDRITDEVRQSSIEITHRVQKIGSFLKENSTISKIAYLQLLEFCIEHGGVIYDRETIIDLVEDRKWTFETAYDFGNTKSILSLDRYFVGNKDNFDITVTRLDGANLFRTIINP